MRNRDCWQKTWTCPSRTETLGHWSELEPGRPARWESRRVSPCSRPCWLLLHVITGMKWTGRTSLKWPRTLCWWPPGSATAPVRLAAGWQLRRVRVHKSSATPSASCRRTARVSSARIVSCGCGRRLWWRLGRVWSGETAALMLHRRSRQNSLKLRCPLRHTRGALPGPRATPAERRPFIHCCSTCKYELTTSMNVWIPNDKQKQTASRSSSLTLSSTGWWRSPPSGREWKTRIQQFQRQHSSYLQLLSQMNDAYCYHSLELCPCTSFVCFAKVCHQYKMLDGAAFVSSLVVYVHNNRFIFSFVDFTVFKSI